MSWNEFLVSLGARGSSSIRHLPQQLARITAAAMQDPVTPTAAVGYIADLRIDLPVSEIAANARVLNLNQGLVANQDLATNIRRPKTAGSPDHVNSDYIFCNGEWHGVGNRTLNSHEDGGNEANGADAVAAKDSA